MALLDVDQWAVDNWWRLLICERCRWPSHSLALRTAATAYSDPRATAPLLLCDNCADAYYEYWDIMWKEHTSRG